MPVGTLITPWLLFKLDPPELKDTPEAPKEAALRLEAMGPMSRDEKIMLVTMGLAVSLWVSPLCPAWLSCTRATYLSDTVWVLTLMFSVPDVGNQSV